jgi:tetratricopeptide (TPR) repeat protein
LEDIIKENRDLVERLTKLVEATNKEVVYISDSKNVIMKPTGGYNFSGDGNHIEFHSTEPTVDELFSRAKNSLINRDYKQAQDILNKVLERASNDANVYYYLALAILEGRRPKSLSEPEVSKIIKILDRAIERNNSKGQFFYLKAIIKYDYNYRSLGNTTAKFESYRLLDATINAGIDDDVETEILNLGPGMGKAITDMISNYKRNE